MASYYLKIALVLMVKAKIIFELTEYACHTIHITNLKCLDKSD
ncbi:hypothetical protein [Shewanella pealeana]|nr:hypothetical protein [Shewanella pealeana]